jgi:hypothetical protein
MSNTGLAASVFIGVAILEVIVAISGICFSKDAGSAVMIERMRNAIGDIQKRSSTESGLAAAASRWPAISFEEECFTQLPPMITKAFRTEKTNMPSG